jgi:hypothetical protein
MIDAATTRLADAATLARGVDESAQNWEAASGRGAKNLPFNSLVGRHASCFDALLRGNGDAAGVESHQTPADSTCLHLGDENTAPSPYLAPGTWNKTRTFMCRQGLNGRINTRPERAGSAEVERVPRKSRVSQRVGPAPFRQMQVCTHHLRPALNEWKSRVG